MFLPGMSKKFYIRYMWIYNIIPFWPPLLYSSVFLLSRGYTQASTQLRHLIKLLLNHSNRKQNETIWILKVENNLWLSTHFAVCTFPTDVCCQEDHLHLGFWHILRSAVSCRCCYVCEVSWLVLSARFAEREVCILKYWETEVCKWVKVMCLSRGLCKCCFCPLLEEFMYL